MTTLSTYSDEAQLIEDVSAQSKTMPATKQPVGKRKQDEADANSKTTPMKRKRVVPAVNPSTNLWKEICKSGSEFFNKAQEYFDVAATNDNISLEDLDRRISPLQQAVQQEHQHALLTPLPSPIQKLLEAIQCSLRTTSKCLSITMENMKQALTNRMDEMEQEIHNIRAEIQPTNIEPLQRDIESVNQRITLLKEDIMKELRGIRKTHSQYSKRADATGPAEGIEDLDIVDSITDRSDDDSDSKSPRQEDSTVEEHPANRLARDQPKKTSTNTSVSSMALPRGKDREQNVGRTEGKSRKLRSNSPSEQCDHFNWTWISIATDARSYPNPVTRVKCTSPIWPVLDALIKTLKLLIDHVHKTTALLKKLRKCNMFKCSNNYYEQVSGLAMGQRLENIIVHFRSAHPLQTKSTVVKNMKEQYESYAMYSLVHILMFITSPALIFHCHLLSSLLRFFHVGCMSLNN
ncbi:unnamed protein product [Nippostrongylus brasiliensis]|uniref:Polyprotein n=1 Tax=Nippostrongylus brasiliensis TaxID=27835 RepID=A0A158QWZ3_NIPBR|nr:unnamed protein product [Nippostrongylus brasiliensis]